MLSDGTVQNDRHAKANRESGSQVQLPEQTHRYLTTENALPPCYFHDDVTIVANPYTFSLASP